MRMGAAALRAGRADASARLASRIADTAAEVFGSIQHPDYTGRSGT